MKVFFLSFIVLLSGCALLKPYMPTPKLSPEQVKERTQKIIENIQSQPEWLFPADACPAEIMPAVEKKIEYLSEGCANNPENCLEKCKSEDGNACYALALLIQEQHGVEEKTSEPLFWRSCKLGIVSGCTNRAAIIFNPETPSVSALQCSADTFEKTCALGDAWGCTMYGTVLGFGEGREPDKEEALKFLAKGCENSSSPDNEACKRARQVEAIIKSKKNKGGERIHY